MYSRCLLRLLDNKAAPRCGLLSSVLIRQQKALATKAEFKINEAELQERDLENARPFSDIPVVPKWDLIIGNLPGGDLHKKSVVDVVDVLWRKYGDIFILPGMFGKRSVVIDSNPNDFPIIFRNEGKWPFRRGFDYMTYYREVYRRDFFEGVGGLIFTNGEEWGKLRTAVNPILMQPKNMVLYLDRLLEVQNEFLKRIRETRDPTTQEMPESFEDDLNRVALDSVTSVAMNNHFGLLRKNRDTPESKMIIECIQKFFDLSYKLEFMPSLWRYVKTPTFIKMMNNLDTMTEICSKYIDEAIKKINYNDKGELLSAPGEEKSVFEKLLRLDKKVAIVMAIDMITAGVDTTSSTMFAILLCMAKNPEKQQKLFEELKQALPQKDSHLTMENLRNLPYLRACIKESMRIYPIVFGSMRALPKDIVLSGYRIPAGIDVAVSAGLLMRDEAFIPKAKEFIPERWIRREDGGNDLAGQIENSFMNMPFGFGPRTCVGKRILNLELELTLANLVRNFIVEYNYPTENPFKARFINVPNIPLKFKLEERPA